MFAMYLYPNGCKNNHSQNLIKGRTQKISAQSLTADKR